MTGFSITLSTTLVLVITLGFGGWDCAAQHSAFAEILAKIIAVNVIVFFIFPPFVVLLCI
jgi:hypothetical protein